MADLPPHLRTALADRYELERELGRGGMATVYLARDLRHRRPVALKVLQPEVASALGADRFLREIEVAANLTHPHILPLYESGEVDGLLYYAMPYIEGESLRDRLRRETQLAVQDAIQIAREVADALAYAHGQGVIHRDIKPENILLYSAHALVADFGIARAVWQADRGRLTETGMAVGTAAYMSPEQASGAVQMDGRSDVYSLGCVLYEMLAGEPPYTGPTAQAILAKQVVDPVPSLLRLRATVPGHVDHAITRALAKVPADRFHTAGEFAAALLSGPDALTPSAGALRPAWKPGISRGGLIAAGIFVVVGLAGSLGLLWKREPPAKPLDANLVAVAPFRIAGTDTSLRYLGEGLVDLLATKLTGQGGPRAADPRSVLIAWRRAAEGATGEVPRMEALRLAQGLGAGQLLIGNVVEGPGRVTLNAAVLAVPGGQSKSETSVEGPLDSLAVLVDRLAGRLLSLGAGEEEQRLATLTTASLPALKAYLEAQASYRRGQYARASTLFGHVLDLDSTFALAAVGLLASAYRTGEYEGVWRGEQLAKASRDRLSPRDQAYLRVLLGMTFSDTTPYLSSLYNAEDFVHVASDRAEAYATLGEVLFNFGEKIGISTAHQRAAAAYRRALELDSSYAPARDNLVLISARSGDTATVRRLARLYQERDSAGDESDVVPRWRIAVALNDQAARDSIRADFEKTDVLNLMGIGQLSQYDGVALEDAEKAHEVWRRRESRGAYRYALFAELVALALNRGRPAEALRLQEEENPDWIVHQFNRVWNALYWEGDQPAGAAAARRLTELAQRLPRGERRVHLCVGEQWRLAHNQLGSARRTIAELRGARVTKDDPAEYIMAAHGCAMLLEAMLSAAEKRADADRHLDRLDSLMRTGPPYRSAEQAWNLVVARLKEAKGDNMGALAATRRRLYFYAEPLYLSTYLREEGRLAAAIGDREGAIRAYQHYLALRSDPEPSLKPQVEQVRAELAQLLDEPD
ncbi:MAG TPA: serine/threonine-protein kinase [Gemmatimonadales bacterium]